MKPILVKALVDLFLGNLFTYDFVNVLTICFTALTNFMPIQKVQCGNMFKHKSFNLFWHKAYIATFFPLPK
jgi:hypothetical protein